MASTWPINYEHSSTNENLVSQVHGPKTRSQCKALCKQDLTATASTGAATYMILLGAGTRVHVTGPPSSSSPAHKSS